ncbi:MAG: peptidoglycan DD-metalloendopeptidase family protein [Arenicellaceae bacterium]|nr:peptidoglycan DD-metalloendopeptidase family protein [Arenicellaceae bacterium]
MILKALLLLVTLALCSSMPLISQEIEGNLTPGGFALVPVFSVDRPSMRFGLKPIAVLDDYADSGVWLGLVGIDILTAPGQYLLTKSKQGHEEQEGLVGITVQPIEHDFRPSRTITTRFEEYLRNVLAKDRGDYAARDIVGEWHESQLFSFPFLLPLEDGEMDEVTIGTYVQYPSGKLDPVNALFLRTNKARTRVIAPSGGIIHRVEQSKDRMVNTNMMINHGQGVFSILKGEIYPEVSVGDIVEAGQSIALVTAGDRRIDRGMHDLSWQLVLNGDLVNPSHFLELDLSAYYQKLITDAEAYFLSIEAAEQLNALQMLEDTSSDQADAPNSTITAQTESTDDQQSTGDAEPTNYQVTNPTTETE